MPTIIKVSALLAISNIFMCFAWYGHLKNLSSKPWIVAALISWAVALFEYLFQVPANRLGAQSYTISQLKILQESISLAVFIPFAVLFMGESIKIDYLWVCLCILGAVYFMFRSSV